MQITDEYRYNRCISIAARLVQIANLISDMDGIDEEFLSDDEYENYIDNPKQTIYELSDRMRIKAKSYATSELSEKDINTWS